MPDSLCFSFVLFSHFCCLSPHGESGLKSEDFMDIAKKLERGKYYNFQMELREFRGKKKVYFIGIA
jgi:hypothetical protein